MAITRLEIEGFRSLKSLDWTPGLLNVIIGPNGSGKSNLLRALSLLQTAATGDLEDYVLRSGGMGTITWDSRAEQIFASVKLHEDISYGITMQRIGMTPDYVISAEMLTDQLSKRLIVRDRNPEIFVLGIPTKLPKRANSTQSTTLSTLSHIEPIDAFGARLRSILVYHDLDVHQHAELRRAAIARRETTLAPDGQNLVSVLHTLYSTNRDFKRTLNDSMHAAFGAEFEELTFPPAADQRVDLRLRWRSLRTEQSAADLSDGTLRFLLLITMLASPTPAEVIAIDEPEIGLHPNMFPIIGELAQEASQRTQVIMTTHSPEFLNAFPEPPTTTVATIENGETKLATLSGDDLADWLRRYTLGDLFRSGQLEAMA